MADKKQEATVRDFLNVVFHRKYLILGVFLMTTVFIVYLKASQPQTYVSSSRVLVKRGERSDIFTLRPTYLTWAEEVASQIEVILSDAVFKRARVIFADSLNARGVQEPLVFNSGAVRADVVGESNVFTIRYSSVNPTECVLGCSAVTEAYRQYYRERTSPPSVKGYFLTEIASVEHDLASWQEKRRDYLSSRDFVGVDEEVRLHLGKLTNLETDLARTRSELSGQQLRVENLRKHTLMSNEELEESLALAWSRNDLQSSIIRELKTELQQQRVHKEDLLNRYTERHPEVVAIDARIRDLQRQLKVEVTNAYQVEVAQLDELMAKIASQQEEVRRAQDTVERIMGKQEGLEKINSEIETLQDKYALLLKKRDEAEINVASAPEWEVTLLVPPTAAWPQRTSDYVRLALGPLLSIIVALGLSFFLESMDHSLKNVAEVEEYLGKPVLASFREVRDKKKVAV